MVIEAPFLLQQPTHVSFDSLRLLEAPVCEDGDALKEAFNGRVGRARDQLVHACCIPAIVEADVEGHGLEGLEAQRVLFEGLLAEFSADGAEI